MYISIKNDKILKQAGAELCQAQFKSGLAIQEVRLSATKYPASQVSKSFIYTVRFSKWAMSYCN